VAGRPAHVGSRSLGKLDQLVEWFKPRQCPKWMKQEDYDALPKSIIVRRFAARFRRKGFRTITVTVVTTLLDPQLYPADELVGVADESVGRGDQSAHLKTDDGMMSCTARA